MEPKNALLVFCLGLPISLLFWRGLVFIKNGSVSVIRGATGLNFHHYHYGIIFIIIASLFIIFYRERLWAIFLMGFGIGTILDGSISRLISSSTRSVEVLNYNENLFPTVVLFGIIILVSGLFYFISKGIKK